MPDGIRIESSIQRSGLKQTRIIWEEDRGLGPLFGTTRGRGSLALGALGFVALAYFLFELILEFLDEGNTSALFLGMMIGAGLVPLAYLLLCESFNQRVVLLDPKTFAAVWRPFPGFNSWKKPASSVTRLYDNDYCLYAEFSDGSRRFLLPRDMTGERHAFVKATLEEELDLSDAGPFVESDVDKSAPTDETPHVESAWCCPICATEGEKQKACTICGAEASAAMPSGVEVKKLESRGGQPGLQISIRSSWELIGFGLLPTVFGLTLPGSVMLAGGTAALPYGFLLLLPSAFLFYIHLLGNNCCIIRLTRETLSVRYEPVPRPGWSRQVSEIEEFAELPRVRFRPKFMPTQASDMVYLVAITRGFRWSPLVLHTHNRGQFRLVRRALKTFFGKKVVRTYGARTKSAE